MFADGFARASSQAKYVTGELLSVSQIIVRMKSIVFTTNLWGRISNLLFFVVILTLLGIFFHNAITAWSPLFKNVTQTAVINILKTSIL